VESFNRKEALSIILGSKALSRGFVLHVFPGIVSDHSVCFRGYLWMLIGTTPVKGYQDET
jgi:hypothetical protein